MNDLLKINVNEHAEKKNGLTYLSWAWAWAEVLKVDPLATWEAIEYPQPDGTTAPCMYVGEGSAMVKTRVTIGGKDRVCLLPVMDHRNKAIKNPDAFAINTAIMRCMTKAISMHGLGLYIYAGEDLPEGEEKAADIVPDTFRSSPTMGAMDQLREEDPDAVMYIETLASVVIGKVKAGEVAEAFQIIEKEKFGDPHKPALWSILPSQTRTALTKHRNSLNTAMEPA